MISLTAARQVMTAASSDDNNDDFDSPTVKSTDPSNGDNNVPTDLSEIKVTFDESIDKNSVDTGSLSLFANNCGNVFCNDPNIDSVSVSSKTATFKISQSSISDLFTPGITYIASISSSIEDQDGNFLDCFDSKGVDDNCEWDFRIADDNSPPTVVSTNPNNDATGVPVTSTISATFSEPMDSLTVDAFTFIVKNAAGTIIPGTILESNFLKTYTFTPTFLLSGSTSYTVTIKGGSGGVEDIAGNSMTSSKEWKFTTATETIPPTVVSTIPDDEDTGVLVNSSVIARFSEPMRDSTISTSTFTIKDGITNVPGAVTLSQNGTNAIFNPTSDLTASTNYTATIKGGSSGVKDVSGNVMTSDKVWSFETAPLVPFSTLSNKIANNSVSLITNHSNATLAPTS